MTLGQRTYTKSDARNGSPYYQKRFKVLFDKWFPGKKSVTLTSSLCPHCGFIIYIPRPQQDDVDTKYRYIDELGQDYGMAVPPDSPVEKKRSHQILRYLNKHIDFSRVNRILDYGGGDGRLMHAFLKIGKECCLVDYNKSCVPDVKKISDTIDDLSLNQRFDLIVCSHVMEHVAQPLQLLNRLASHLNLNGHIFIEVPMEVWRKPPLRPEPVTHINFFTPGSVHNLLRLSKLLVRSCEMCGSLHQSGKRLHAVRALAKRSNNPATLGNTPLLSPDAVNLLNPNAYVFFRFHLCTPEAIIWETMGRIRKILN